MHAGVPRVEPHIRVGRIQVPVLVWHVLIGADGPGVGEEPDFVAQDWSAEREVGVPVANQRRLIDEPIAFQFGVDVAALRPFAGQAREVEPAEGVAARLRDHVERRAAAIDFGKTASDGDLHLGRVRHVVLITRHTATAD